MSDLPEKLLALYVADTDSDGFVYENDEAREALKDFVEALDAAEGVLFALPKSAMSSRRREVLAQIRAARARLRAALAEDA